LGTMLTMYPRLIYLSLCSGVSSRSIATTHPQCRLPIMAGGSSNHGVELTGADVSVFGWSGFMLFISWLSAPAAHPERWG
jgi:hypothetical protein